MSFALGNKIKICEVGLRDGLQNEKTIVSTEDKVKIVNNLVDAGFKTIEVGSFVSPKAVPQMANTGEVFAALKAVEGVEYRAFVANVKGVERAAESGCKKIKLNVSASLAHNMANINKTPSESVASFKDATKLAREHNMEVSGSISMAFGSPWDKEISIASVEEIVKAYIDVNITEISLSDASGMAYPTQVFDMCTYMKKAFPNVNWWLHFHNTRGLGLANVIAGLSAGFTQFDSAFAGIGGCPFVPDASGNISSEDLIYMCHKMNVESGIDVNKSIAIAKDVISIVGEGAKTDSYILKAGTSEELFEKMGKK